MGSATRDQFQKKKWSVDNGDWWIYIPIGSFPDIRFLPQLRVVCHWLRSWYRLSPTSSLSVRCPISSQVDYLCNYCAHLVQISEYTSMCNTHDAFDLEYVKVILGSFSALISKLTRSLKVTSRTDISTGTADRCSGFSPENFGKRDHWNYRTLTINIYQWYRVCVCLNHLVTLITTNEREIMFSRGMHLSHYWASSFKAGHWSGTVGIVYQNCWPGVGDLADLHFRIMWHDAWRLCSGWWQAWHTVTTVGPPQWGEGGCWYWGTGPPCFSCFLWML